MKLKISIISGILAIGAFSSCNDSFMDRYPGTSISDENFWNSDEDLKLYCNNFYTSINGHGFDNAPSPLLIGDNQSDNMVPLDYNIIAAGEYVIPSEAGSGGWDWGFIRKCNYFLVNYNRVNAAQKIKDQYAGEVKYFKSVKYFEKVKRFGDIPWLNKVLDVTDVDVLYAKRDSRIMVMDSVLADIDFAIEHLPSKKDATLGRVNRDVALALKARICLHEGTFRKYHNIEGSEKFLREAVNASETLMKEGNYSIYNTGHPESDYFNLFTILDLNGNCETIFYKQYEKDLLMNSASNYVENNTSKISVDKSLVESYLCKDGLPISLSKLYLGDDSIQAEMQNRDPRLTQTVCYPGTMVQVSSKMPNIPGSNLGGGQVLTGYQVVKYWNSEDNINKQGVLDCPIYRYAEVLLVYAEAKAELGECTQGDIDKTINLLRKRAGMPDMEISNLKKDPKSDFPEIPVLIDEIRRERRVELALESLRYDDLMRWKAGRLLTKPVRGMKFVQSQYPDVKVGKDIFVDAEGYIEPYAKALPHGRTFQENKHYYFPIPTEDLMLNTNLVQNPNWE